jgi:hypothetical protein
MFAVIYQAYLKVGQEVRYQQLWQQIASYFIEKRGAIGSCLHRTEEGIWVAYSRWPDRATRDRSWPGDAAPSEELPIPIQEAVVALRECIDTERLLPDICMEVVNDLLKNFHKD